MTNKLDQLKEQLKYVIPLLEQKRPSCDPDSIPILEKIIRRFKTLLAALNEPNEEFKSRPFHIIGAAIAYFDSVSNDINDPIINEIAKVEKWFKEIRD